MKRKNSTFLAKLEERLGPKRLSRFLSHYTGRVRISFLSERKALGKKPFCEAARLAKNARRAVTILAKNGTYVFSYPVLQKGRPSFFIIGRFAKKPTEGLTGFLSHVITASLKGVSAEMNYDVLHRTMQPRMIALSTVHTVHRLMGSSPELEDLLTRIARLSMQVIKAQRCSVKLVDSRKKTLIPKATVDLRQKETKLKKVLIGRWAPGKAVKYGKTIRTSEYLSTPLIDEDVIGAITLYDKVDGTAFNAFDEEIMRTLAEQVAIAIKNTQLYKAQERLTLGSIRALAQIIESRGPGIYAPTKTSYLRLVQLIGIELGIREHELKNLQYAALLHDAGELMVPEKILKKKGKLTRQEHRVIEEHPLKGATILKSLKSLKSVTPIILHHHENFDGSGYPDGLKGSDIPLGSRIMAVVDAFEAMITKRPYRVTLTIEKAIEEIKKNALRQFDPDVVKALLKVVARKDMRRLLGSERQERKK
ncbi:MAG: HD domain-containing protein [Candidatus Omnitrophica bacterium]|nr:HD domain-containing protein [Candidatus Omnitrophota bacterium]